MTAGAASELAYLSRALKAPRIGAVSGRIAQQAREEGWDYEAYLDLAVGALRPGGLLIADNLTSHASELAGFRARALTHERLSSVVVPIGNGELVGVRLPD